MIWLTKDPRREDMLLRRVSSEAACGSDRQHWPSPFCPSSFTCLTLNQDQHPPLFSGVLLVLAHHLLLLRPSASFWSECLIPPGAYRSQLYERPFESLKSWSLKALQLPSLCLLPLGAPTKVHKRGISEVLLPVGGPGFHTISHTPGRPTQRWVIIEEPIITNLDFDMTGIGQKPQIYKKHQ